MQYHGQRKHKLPRFYDHCSCRLGKGKSIETWGALIRSASHKGERGERAGIVAFRQSAVLDHAYLRGRRNKTQLPN